jgi:hypothetical protein
MAAIAIGAAGLAFEFFRDPARAYGGLLIAGLFGVLLSLGGAIMIVVHVLGGARRWEPMREWPMALAGLLPVPAAMVALVMFVGRTTIYPWADPEIVAHSEILQQKMAWFSTPFVLSRTVIVLLIWLALVAALRSHLWAHIQHGTEATRRRLVRTSAIFIVTLAPTLSVAAWDWAMSLEPEWFSTMYGVYFFSGALLAAIAAVALLLPADPPHQRATPMRAEVRHDVGKLLFAFSAFWVYIWFCQYMLIWYANIPEETTYFALRQAPAWVAVFWLSPVLNFVLPFVVLMPASTKKRPRLLQHIAVIVLIGRWFDVYLMVAPPLAPDGGFPFGALAATGMLLGVFALAYPPARPVLAGAPVSPASGGAVLVE